MITTIEEALSYITERAEEVRRDILTHKDLGTAYFVWDTNRQTPEGDQVLIDAVNEHARQMEMVNA